MNLIDSENGHRYEILSLLGQGGFGKVYRALDENGSDVAVKALDVSVLLRTPQLKERVNEEVRIHSKLQHPSVLPFKNVFQDATNVYIVLEYCPNGDIAALLRRRGGKPFEAKEALKWFVQIMNGIEYLHRNLIVHRDLTLSNCLLDSRFDVKIADFGLATQLRSRNEVRTTMCGTPIAIAPEIVSRVPSDPEPADVWGLGCILYTLLVGRSPFEMEGIGSTMKKVVCDEPDFPNDLPLTARDLLFRMLRKNPAERISLKEISRHPFVNGEKTSELRTFSCDSGIGTTGFSFGNTSEVRRSFTKMSIPQPPSNLLRQRSWSEISNIPNNHAPRVISHPSSLSVASAPIPTSNKPSLTLSSPIKSHRLRPTSKRQQLKVGTACVLNDGRVQLEFRLGKGGYNLESFTVSTDGLFIDISSTKKKESYSYEGLPKNYWQKYNYAARYAKFVREKTPKITLWSDRAKCQLMENGPVSSFEASFYDESAKINFSAQNGIRVILKAGEDSSYSYPLSLKPHDPNNEHLRHFEDCHTRCKRTEDLLETNASSVGSVFPITIGRRPSTDPKSSQPQMSSSASTFSVRSDGIRSFASDHTTKVDFEDNTRIELGPDDEIKYFVNGRLLPLTKFDLPPEVKSKLARIDSHIKSLRQSTVS